MKSARYFRSNDDNYSRRKDLLFNRLVFGVISVYIANW